MQLKWLCDNKDWIEDKYTWYYSETESESEEGDHPYIIALDKCMNDKDLTEEDWLMLAEMLGDCSSFRTALGESMKHIEPNNCLLADWIANHPKVVKKNLKSKYEAYLEWSQPRTSYTMRFFAKK